MRSDWVDRIAFIYGVDCSLIVDGDGLVVSMAGSASDKIAPHTARLVRQLMEKVGVKALDEWNWIQCETEKIIIGITYVYVGVLVLVMQSDANISKVQIEADNLRRDLRKQFKGPFIT